MSKIQQKPATLLLPVPAVLVSCGTVEKPNAITVAWTGIVNSDPPKTYVSVRPSRFSHSIIKESGEFVINLTNEALVRATDFCGVKSGRDVDKFTHCGLTAEKSFAVSAPSIAQSPISLECKVCDILSLGTHDMFLADIVSVSVDESLLDENDKLSIEKCALAAYANGKYFALGKKLGDAGFSIRKK